MLHNFKLSLQKHICSVLYCVNLFDAEQVLNTDIQERIVAKLSVQGNIQADKKSCNTAQSC